jgi:hypothetical protein
MIGDNARGAALCATAANSTCPVWPIAAPTPAPRRPIPFSSGMARHWRAEWPQRRASPRHRLSPLAREQPVICCDAPRSSWVRTPWRPSPPALQRRPRTPEVIVPSGANSFVTLATKHHRFAWQHSRNIPATAINSAAALLTCTAPPPLSSGSDMQPDWQQSIESRSIGRVGPHITPRA